MDEMITSPVEEIKETPQTIKRKKGQKKRTARVEQRVYLFDSLLEIMAHEIRNDSRAFKYLGNLYTEIDRLQSSEWILNVAKRHSEADESNKRMMESFKELTKKSDEIGEKEKLIKEIESLKRHNEESLKNAELIKNLNEEKFKGLTELVQEYKQILMIKQ